MKTRALITIVRMCFILFNRAFNNTGAKIAERLFLTPRSPNYTIKENEFLATGEKISIPYSGYSLNGWTWGDPSLPIVLLVHGWTSNPATSFKDFVPALQKQGYCVVSYCAPAHGNAPQQDTVMLSQWADSVTAVAQNIGPVYGVVGHSLGAAGVVIATKAGFQPKKIILISPLADIVWAAHVKFAPILGISPKIIDLMLDNIMKKYRSITCKYGSDWYQVFKSAYQTDTLIIHDKYDEEIDWKQGREIYQRWPWSEFVSTENLGHCDIVHDKATINKIVDFLKSKNLVEI